MSEGQCSTQVLSVLKNFAPEHDVQLVADSEHSLQFVSHAVQVEAAASWKNLVRHALHSVLLLHTEHPVEQS